jgi:hypothetical protein
LVIGGHQLYDKSNVGNFNDLNFDYQFAPASLYYSYLLHVSAGISSRRRAVHTGSAADSLFV